MFSHRIGRLPYLRFCAPLIFAIGLSGIARGQEISLPPQSPSTDQSLNEFQTPGPMQAPGPIQTPGSMSAPSAVQSAGPAIDPQLAESAIHHVRAANERMDIIANSSRVLTLDQNIPRAQVNNKEILELTPLSPREIQVFAKKPGVTQINLWNDKGQLFTIDCIVSADARELSETIRSLFPNANIQVHPIGTGVLLTGYIDRDDQVTTIINIAKNYYPDVQSTVEVASVQQVLLHCKVAEVDRNKLREVGFDFANIADNGSFVVSSISGLISAASVRSGAVPAGAGDTVRFGVVDGNNSFFGFLEALRQEEILKILSDPTVTTVSGRAASFIVGGEFPILVPQSLGTVSIQYKEFGTQLDFVPIVMGNGNIRLEVRPRVSEIDETRALTINGTTVPGLRVRQVDTGVEMKPGQTLALAGLVQTRIEGRVRGIPWLSELPYVGAPFRTVRQREEEIELVILVTPELAAGLDPCEVPKCLPGMHTDVPNDCEMVWKGYIEVPSKGPCGPKGCCPTPAVDPAACYSDGSPAVQAPPSPGYEVIPPGTQGPSAPNASRGPMSIRPPKKTPATSMRPSPTTGNNSPTTTNANDRYHPTLPQNPAAAGEMKPVSAAPGFIGPVGYDVKN
ncbi:MAG: pilus assembly protein N-terminal domain-containing protein [Pirellulales bacterium]|nr:pilus assembly protein N-terminal domain-containing protein [Pirellulales bacterium]